MRNMTTTKTVATKYGLRNKLGCISSRNANVSTDLLTRNTDKIKRANNAAKVTW